MRETPIFLSVLGVPRPARLLCTLLALGVALPGTLSAQAT